MELENISSQMKSVIRKHQLIVEELKSDPQNPMLLKRLHEAQCEIRCLDEKQKQVVDGLRKNLERSSQNINSTNFVPHSAATQPPSNIQNPNQGIMNSTQKSPLANYKLPTTTIVTKPIANCMNTVRQTVPPTINNINNIATPTAATFTFKAPMGTVVLPNCSSAANTLLTSKVADHHKMHPLLVVPSPSNRTADGPQTGVLFNLVPPIRVPQYPPPPLSRMPGPITCQKNPIVNNCIPVAIAGTSASIQQFNMNSDSNLTSSSESPPISSCEKHHQSNNMVENNLEQKMKLDFLAVLGLVSKDSLLDIKNKKSERKRRSTANPQFSNAAIEEKMRNAAATTTTPQRRPRGRPRLETKPVVCPTNGIMQSQTESKSTDMQVESNTLSHSISVNSSHNNDSSTIVNGIHKPVTNSEEGKNVEQMLSGLCIVCTQPGDLVKCDTCAKQQHLGCMQPPLIARPQIPWQCSECQSRTVSLTVVQNYDMLKAAKEDEKRKLLKKSLELRLKRSQLEGRLNQLKEYSNNQKNRQSELETSLKGTETLVGRINSVINGVRLCS